MNLGLDIDVTAKRRSSNPAHTKGNFLTQMPLPAQLVMHDLWDLYLFSLLLSLPRATSLLLSWTVYVKGFVICFYTSIEKQYRMAYLRL